MPTQVISSPGAVDQFPTGSCISVATSERAAPGANWGLRPGPTVAHSRLRSPFAALTFSLLFFFPFVALVLSFPLYFHLSFIFDVYLKHVNGVYSYFFVLCLQVTKRAPDFKTREMAEARHWREDRRTATKIISINYHYFNYVTDSL